MASEFEIDGVGDLLDVIQDIVSGNPDQLSLAHYYLTTLYGDWILGGEGYTIVTSTFSIINFMAAALGVLIFFAAFTTGIARTALEGEFMGKEWGNDYMAIKMFVGAAMMMPVFVDYNVSLSQKLALQVLMAGSNAADYTWRRTVENAIINPGAPNNPRELNSVAETFFRGATCAVAMSKHGLDDSDNPLMSFYYNESVGSNGRNSSRNRLSIYLDGDVNEAGMRRALADIDQLFARFQSGGATVEKIEFGTRGSCGIYKMPPLPGRFNEDLNAIENPNELYRNTGSDQWSTQFNGEWESDEGQLHAILGRVMVESGYKSLPHIKTLTKRSFNMAFSLVQMGWGRANDAKDAESNDADRRGLINMAENYIETRDEFSSSVLGTIDDVITSGSDDQGQASWQMTVKQLVAQKGWLYAGAWVMQLGKIMSIGPETAAKFTDHEPKVPEKICKDNWWGTRDPDCDAAKDIAVLSSSVIAEVNVEDPENIDPISVSRNCVSEGCSSIEVEDSITSAATKQLLSIVMTIGVVNNSPFTHDADVNAGSSVIYYDENSPTRYVQRAGMDAENQSNPITNATGTANPFSTLIQLGHGLLNIAHMIEAASLGLDIVKDFSHSLGDSLTDSWFGKALGIAAFTVENLIGQLLTRLFAASVLFMALGVMLAYILPFLPLIRWLGPTIGWIIMSAEYLIMAAIAMMLLLIPEGRGILGTNLMTVVRYIGAGFLRPTLSVMALVASYVLAFVCFGFFNGIYWETVSITTDMSLFELVIVFYLYGFIAYQIIDKLMSLCINLVKDALRWMSPGGEPFGDAYFGGVEVRPDQLSRQLFDPGMDAVANRAKQKQ